MDCQISPGNFILFLCDWYVLHTLAKLLISACIPWQSTHHGGVKNILLLLNINEKPILPIYLPQAEYNITMQIYLRLSLI